MPDEAEEGARPVGHAAVPGDQDRHHLGRCKRRAADVEHGEQLPIQAQRGHMSEVRRYRSEVTVIATGDRSEQIPRIKTYSLDEIKRRTRG